MTVAWIVNPLITLKLMGVFLKKFPYPNTKQQSLPL